MAKYPIPKLICNRTIKYDVSHISMQKEKNLSFYVRNNLCYRSYKTNNNLPKILVIGGSTTDERYLTEGKTFVDLLDLKFKDKFDFINGGIDGQSSYGHLISIQNWHSKALKKENIEEIIFYFGINDNVLVYENIPFYRRNSKMRHLFDFFDRNSFFYRFAKSIYTSKKLPRNFSLIASHSKKFRFSDSNEIKKIKINEMQKYYIEGINNLIFSTLEAFPSSSIKIIQQQIPGCKFFDKYSVVDRHGKDSDLCKQLGEVFINMDLAIKLIPSPLKNKLSVHKMYLENVLDDNDVYDAIHSNYSGSNKIADYIESLYK